MRLLLFFAGVLGLNSALVRAAGPTVTISSGPIIGVTTTLPTVARPVNQYLGIPYAISPPERFSRPSSPQNWTTPLRCQVHKDACIQQWNCKASLLAL